VADRWPFDRVRAAAQSLGLPTPGILPGDPFAIIVDTARSWLVGKKRTISFGGDELTMTLTDISIQGSDVARLVGQYGQVRFTARDVLWGGQEFERLQVQVRNVHLRPGTRPLLVVAPVLVEAFVTVAAASRFLASVSSRLELTVKDGVPQVGVIGAPWLRLEVETGAGGESLRVQPRAVHLFEQRLALWSPAFNLPVPSLPSGLVLTSVEAAPGGFTVRGILSEWQRSVARDDLDHLLTVIRGRPLCRTGQVRPAAHPSPRREPNRAPGACGASLPRQPAAGRTRSRTRIMPSCMTEATSVPDRSKSRPRHSARAPAAQLLLWS
jgi:LmeA-like phospholipid-binding